jgi:hypothetical protein
MLFNKLFDFRRAFSFEGESGGAGGGTPPASPPEPAPAPTGGGTPGQGAEEGGTPAEIKLTSAQLSERLDRAKGSERTTLLKSLGFENLEAAQAAIKAGQEALQAKMSAEEKQAALLKAAQDRATELEKQAQQATQQASQALMQSEAMGLMAGRFASPKAAFKLLDLSGVERQSDGTFKGLSEAVEKLAKDEPWTLAAQTTTKTKVAAPPIGPTNPEGGDGKQTETDDDRRKRYFGAGAGSGGFFGGGGVKPAVEKRPK